MSKVEELIDEIDKTPVGVTFGPERKRFIKNKLVIIQAEQETINSEISEMAALGMKYKEMNARFKATCNKSADEVLQEVAKHGLLSESKAKKGISVDEAAEGMKKLGKAFATAMDRNELEKGVAKILEKFLEADWDFNDESETEQGSMEYAEKIIELFEEQNKPVEIPEFVADWMEEYKGDYRTPYHSMRTAAELENNVGDWLHDNDTTEQDIKNQEKYLQAWLTGNYTAKQEQKYQILKLHVDYFDAVAKGIKTFEIRKNDRNFQIGNILVLREYDPIGSNTDNFTGREFKVEVTYTTDYEQKPGYVVLGIVPVKEEQG